MTAPVTVHKLHATGNDFVVVAVPGPAGDEVRARLDGAIAAAWCDRHTGLGADGLIIVTDGAEGADCTMTLFNADGGEAEMSGNGIRALARVAHAHGFGSDDDLVVDTGGGRRRVALTLDGGAVVAATVDMGAATTEPAEIPVDLSTALGIEATVAGVHLIGDAVGMGNPHLVVRVDDVARTRVAELGPALERDHRFPNRTNVEFVQVDDDRTITMRVWERGVGETLSCGTGACAAAFALHELGLVDEQVTVRVPGGDLDVVLGDTILLGGPVVEVFTAEVDPDDARWVAPAPSRDGA